MVVLVVGIIHMRYLWNLLSTNVIRRASKYTLLPGFFQGLIRVYGFTINFTGFAINFTRFAIKFTGFPGHLKEVYSVFFSLLLWKNKP